jgi:hypothetical protein
MFSGLYSNHSPTGTSPDLGRTFSSEACSDVGCNNLSTLNGPDHLPED